MGSGLLQIFNVFNFIATASSLVAGVPCMGAWVLRASIHEGLHLSERCLVLFLFLQHEQHLQGRCTLRAEGSSDHGVGHEED